MRNNKAASVHRHPASAFCRIEPAQYASIGSGMPMSKTFEDLVSGIYHANERKLLVGKSNVLERYCNVVHIDDRKARDIKGTDAKDNNRVSIIIDLSLHAIIHSANFNRSVEQYRVNTNAKTKVFFAGTPQKNSKSSRVVKEFISQLDKETKKALKNKKKQATVAKRHAFLIVSSSIIESLNNKNANKLVRTISKAQKAGVNVAIAIVETGDAKKHTHKNIRRIEKKIGKRNVNVTRIGDDIAFRNERKKTQYTATSVVFEWINEKTVEKSK